MQTADCDANASLSSTGSRSATPMPARSSALREAGTGPTPMIAGSTPATAVETTAPSAAGPAPRPLRLDDERRRRAVVDARRVPAVTEPPSRNAGRSFASASIDVSARGCSSRATTTASPFFCGTSTGMICESNRPPSMCDRSLVRQQREGVLPLARDVIRGPIPLHHVLGGLAHRVQVVHRGELRVDEPPAERRVRVCRTAVHADSDLPSTNGARVIDSTPRR